MRFDKNKMQFHHSFNFKCKGYLTCPPLHQIINTYNRNPLLALSDLPESDRNANRENLHYVFISTKMLKVYSVLLPGLLFATLMATGC